ncbi:MAG: aminotransferase class III-fold pyridoxal phosphate-dependent enzyme [Lentisphaerae bacterium]|nr:aminotransferase class III-fold pyridoxal phosphate-dependent enzyme [Lentisphaerota bacterium]
MINPCAMSLRDLAGESYIEAVCRASSALGLGTYSELMALASEKVDFYPPDLVMRGDRLLADCGKPLCVGLPQSVRGAGTKAFDEALKRSSAPLSGLGFFRVGEDGRLAALGKSEHYQASLGHNFPGYRLLSYAARIGITNITHNNTRGHLTRRLEQELIRIANGLRPGDEDGLQRVLDSTEPHVLNRVINLETGSLAVEAGLKMMLARFYRLQTHFPEPKYAGRTPVFLVLADFKGGKEANYHGTTVVAQMLRGMWPDFYQRCEQAGILKVIPVRINDTADFQEKVELHDQGTSKVAGFFHELVLMNYGGIRLDNDYVTNTHALCDQRDIPVLVDEIQSCLWSPELFLFKEYRCHPDFVSVGKGFPGGQFPAAKILTTAAMDNLNQFGALVTNGQEEIASLANLITMAFAEANSEYIKAMGELWQKTLRGLAQRHPQTVMKIEGHGHLASLVFADTETCVGFCHKMTEEFAFDISAQTYKPDCPPAALTKLPLIATPALVDFAASAMHHVLAAM